MTTSQVDGRPAEIAARLEALEMELARLKSEIRRPHEASPRRDEENERGSGTQEPASRREVLRLGAVALGAVAAGLTARPAEAANGGPVVIGATNLGSAGTLVQSSQSSGYALQGWATSVSGPNLAGVRGDTLCGDGYGVIGVHASDPGTDPIFGGGVLGQTFGTPNGGVGVRGLALSGPGPALIGEIPSQSSANAIAIYGLNNSAYAGPGPGAGGFGVYGLSARGHGLVGATAAAGAAAVVGATNGVAGAYAGVFYGPVLVGGNFTVVGGAKSAAVPHPDGSHRRLYCMESPESWFEDFGTGHIECGRAEILIDPDFAALVDLSDYHVFLTEHDTHQHLIVRDRTAAAFAVEADAEIATLKGKQDADLNGAFSWRIVAKRKDITGERLETVTIPVEPILPAVPDIPSPTPPRPRHD